jgi:hypothetical protein
MTTDPVVPWPVTAVESRGGTWLRITHADGTVADHDLARLVARGGVFAGLAAETIAAAQVIDDTVAWVIGEQALDIAPDGLWDHTRGRCGGGGCSGWTPDQTVVVDLS